MPINALKKFVNLESKSSILLLVSALCAVLIANSPWNLNYEYFINYSLGFSLPYFQVSTTVKLLVNDGLMTLFFLLISLEVKRSMLIGELNSRKKASLPLIASIGGVLGAALVYLIINYGLETSIRGWAVPTATDIAFSSAVLLLLGRSVPKSLRLFLSTLAIIDDVIAIIIIALFYSVDFQILFLLLAVFCFIGLLLLNKLRLVRYELYVVLGMLLWICIEKSHVSPPMAGVLLGISLPLHSKKKDAVSPLEKFEEMLHPWVSYGILPIFVFVNGGLFLLDTQVSMLFNPITLGIILGLFLGKQAGIFTFCRMAVLAKVAKLPDDVSWRQMYGLSVLGGIGFTMNLFIGFLAFADSVENLNLVKLGVFSASILSAIVGYVILRSTVAKS